MIIQCCFDLHLCLLMRLYFFSCLLCICFRSVRSEKKKYNQREFQVDSARSCERQRYGVRDGGRELGDDNKNVRNCR